MALIEKAKGRREEQSPSGYTRLFGIPALGQLMSRVQGAVISAGTELEDLIWERVNRVEDLDRFLSDTLHKGEDRIYIARQELAVLFKFDYNEIVLVRTSDQQSNLDYFIKEILKIPNIKNMIIKRLQESKPVKFLKRLGL